MSDLINTRRCFRVLDVDTPTVEEVSLLDIRRGDLFVLLDAPSKEGPPIEDGTAVHKATSDGYLGDFGIHTIECLIDPAVVLPRPIIEYLPASAEG